MCPLIRKFMEHVIPAETEALMVAKLAASSEQLASLPPQLVKFTSTNHTCCIQSMMMCRLSIPAAQPSNKIPDNLWPLL